MTKPEPTNCLPSCKVQHNEDKMSFALYPHRFNFFHQKTFCHVASHIWQVTCQDESRKFFLEMKHPNLCKILSSFEAYFGSKTTCHDWPGNYLDVDTSPNTTLIDEMVLYGRENLALVKVIMQSPYVTKIKRDVAMSFTAYVANTGGLLGLCLGFSFISGIEILFWVCCCCRKFKRC